MNKNLQNGARSGRGVVSDVNKLIGLTSGSDDKLTAIEASMEKNTIDVTAALAAATDATLSLALYKDHNNALSGRVSGIEVLANILSNNTEKNREDIEELKKLAGIPTTDDSTTPTTPDPTTPTTDGPTTPTEDDDTTPTTDGPTTPIEDDDPVPTTDDSTTPLRATATRLSAPSTLSATTLSATSAITPTNLTSDSLSLTGDGNTVCIGVDGFTVERTINIGGYEVTKKYNTRFDAAAGIGSLDVYYYREEQIFGSDPEKAVTKFNFSSNGVDDFSTCKFLIDSPRTSFVIDFSQNPVKSTNTDVNTPFVLGLCFNVVSDVKPIYTAYVMNGTNTNRSGKTSIFDIYGVHASTFEPFPSTSNIYYNNNDFIDKSNIWVCGGTLIHNYKHTALFNGKVVFIYGGDFPKD